MILGEECLTTSVFDESPHSLLPSPFEISNLKVSGLLSQLRSKPDFLGEREWINSRTLKKKKYFPIYKLASFFIILQNKEPDQSLLVYAETILI